MDLNRDDEGFTAITMNPDTLLQEVSNPTVRALLKDGWRPFGMIPMEDSRDGTSRIVVFLSRDKRAHRAEQLILWTLRAAIGTTLLAGAISVLSVVG